MGAQSDAARTRVELTRVEVLDEIARLEAVTRSSLDIGSRVREDPLRAVAITGLAAFLVLGGPFRVVRFIRRRIRQLIYGRPPEFPPSMLPDEVERTLRKMGAEGDTARGTLERDFARYLAERGSFTKPGASQATGQLLSSLLGPAARLAGLRLARSMATANPKTYGARLERARARWVPGKEDASADPDEGAVDTTG
jgi:hypothetical protein